MTALDRLAALLVEPPDLPVAAGLAQVRDAVRRHGVAVLQAPPGSGKTTLVPPAVAVATAGRVIVTQPRRIAARAAAYRLASLLDEPVGQSVGFTVRGESRTSRATRVEMVTTGVLLRRLQRDPDLPGVAAVVLDEVHERQVDADLTLALLIDVRRHLREDLVVVAMSATLEAERLAALLGGAPVVDVPGSLHPVARHWAPPPPGVLPRDERGVTWPFLDHVAATTRRALAEQPGDVLVFLPGVGEIAQVVRRLAGSGVDVLELHGRLDARDQDRALTPGPRRRIVVATTVAESSLTVPGVRTVVDAGLARRPQTDHRRGLAGLVTTRTSKAAADQRAGRAGREAPGAVYRCWSESEHAHLADHAEPEIATADLAGFALELATWGSPDGTDLALLDRPPAPAMRAARETLRAIGAVDDAGQVTERGRAMARVPTDPRLARALLDGSVAVGSKRAAAIVALISEEVRAPGSDLAAALRDARRNPAWRAAASRLESAAPPSGGESGTTDDQAVGIVVALAHPGRIARLRPSERAGGSTYATVGGTGAVLPPGSPLVGTPWLAIADADRRPGQRDATIRAAAPIDEVTALEAADVLWREADVVTWTRGRITARRVTSLGAIELSSTSLSNPDPGAVAQAVADALRREGLGILRWTEAATRLRQRMAFLHRSLGDPWPDVDDDALLARATDWLDGRDPRTLDLTRALRRLLPWPEAGRLDELAPEAVVVPSGSQVKIDYAHDQPVLAVRLQEMFGLTETPRLADGRVPLLLHLLSPARRPAAVTADLASFWATGYAAVRADLRGRYPKHSWPDDPLSTPPTTGPPRRPR